MINGKEKLNPANITQNTSAKKTKQKNEHETSSFFFWLEHVICTGLTDYVLILIEFIQKINK